MGKNPVATDARVVIATVHEPMRSVVSVVWPSFTRQELARGYEEREGDGDPYQQ